MRKIIVYATTSIVGAKREDSFEVEDDATEEEINEIAEEYINELIETGWYEEQK